MFSRDETLKNYRILDVAGKGSYGMVYKVEDLNNPGRILALKEMVEANIPEDEREDACKLFHREAEILRSLHHKGLPKVFEAFSIENRHYLVMEYIQGRTFEELLKLKGVPFTSEEIIPWARQLAGILDYLHRQKPHPVIFRDLKPSNIMVDEKNFLRLIDFGIARHFSPQKTRDTFFMGTPGFSAPEQYGSGQSDQRTDIYSFGATLYYLLTLEDLPKYNFKLPPLNSLSLATPDWLESVIMRSLSVNPGERYQSVSELLRDLELQVFTPTIPVQDTPASPTAAAPAAVSLPVASWPTPVGIWKGWYFVVILSIFMIPALVGIDFFGILYMLTLFAFLYYSADSRFAYQKYGWTRWATYSAIATILTILLLAVSIIYAVAK